ncbi:MAG: ABC transporter substrate-binding protein [Aristaeellaceae bacterium]
MSKKLVSLFLALLMVFSMSAVMAEDTSVTITDMYGREITLSAPATRIVALSAAECEIVCALGCEDMLVGRGEYCNYPESIASVPAVQSGTNTNIEEILALEPQVIIMSDMSQPEEQVRLLEENGVKVVVTRNTDIEGVYYAITMIGALLGKDAEAEAMVTAMKAAFADIAANSENTGKTVYFEVSPLQWGLYTAGAGTFMDEIAKLCGLTNAFADIEGWAAISEEQVLERNPDYIVSVSGMPEADVEIMSREAWAKVNAVANGDVLNADADAFSRPGPRLKDAAESLYNFINDTAVEEVPAA